MTEAQAVAALVELGLPPDALSDLVALIRCRISAGRPGPVEMVVHVGPRRIAGASVREERHYPARQTLTAALS
jgi:hypothetical protein